MLLDYPIPPVSEKERTVSKNETRRRFETPSGVVCHSLEKPHSMVCRSYCEVDEYYRVTGIPVCTPRAIRRQVLKRGWNLVWIPADIEPYRFKNSCNHIVYISSHHVSAGICNSLTPFPGIPRSKPFPVLLENAYTSFTLIDLVAATKCYRCHRRSIKTGLKHAPRLIKPAPAVGRYCCYERGTP